MINFNNYTVKARECFELAQKTLARMSHQQLSVEHLFYAMLEQNEDIIKDIFENNKINIKSLKSDTQKLLDRIPSVRGVTQELDKVYVTQELQKVFLEAENVKLRFKDEYVSLEHILLAIFEV